MTRLALCIMALCLGLTYFSLKTVDFWLAHVFLGVIWGVSFALIWVWGVAVQTVAYWRGTCPRWVYILLRRPGHTEKAVGTYLRQMKAQHKAIKPFAVIYAAMPLIIFAGSDPDIYKRLSEAISFVIAWSLIVYSSERHFKRRYTRIKDWSTFKPFDELE